MGGVAEACPPSEPPPCCTAMCSCAGGGFSGAGIPLLPPSCISFFDPCNNRDQLCNQCYRESGCANSKLGDGKQGWDRTRHMHARTKSSYWRQIMCEFHMLA